MSMKLKPFEDLDNAANHLTNILQDVIKYSIQQNYHACKIKKPTVLCTLESFFREKERQDIVANLSQTNRQNTPQQAHSSV